MNVVPLTSDVHPLSFLWCFNLHRGVPGVSSVKTTEWHFPFWISFNGCHIIISIPLMVLSQKFFSVTSITSLFFRLFFSLSNALLLQAGVSLLTHVPLPLSSTLQNAFWFLSYSIVISLKMRLLLHSEALPSRNISVYHFVAVIASANWMFKQINSSSWSLFFRDILVWFASWLSRLCFLVASQGG